MDVINRTKTKLFHLYIISIINFDDPMFYDFTKFLQHSNDVLPLQTTHMPFLKIIITNQHGYCTL
jgi:hypothetical protein